jgi:dTDP-glucose pyrophosphorylase
MKNWEETLIPPKATLRDALEAIDRSGRRIALVVDPDRRLIGTLSDGDVRRLLLQGLTLADTVTAAIHSLPTCAKAGDDRRTILATMRRVGLHQIPVIDANGVVVGLQTVDDFLTQPPRPNWVVIMAGGRGERLEELTRDIPKPMLRVGPRPLLESILLSYTDQGFRRFFIAVNHKAEQIEAHFGDGRRLGVSIEYLRESMPLGTAGALSLLPERPALPFVVTNADLLTKENYGSMLDGHLESGADATMAVRDHSLHVPFGVVHARDERIVGIDEKPTHHFVVSAGTYVLSPTILDLVPSRQRLDMPSLFETLIAREMLCRCHHVEGYWLDIGRLSDYERANLDFPIVFP